MGRRNKLNIGKARRRVQIRSALLLTLGVCYAIVLYRMFSSLNSLVCIWPTHTFGVLLEALVTLLVLGGGAYLGLCVLNGDQRKIIACRVLSREQIMWLALTGVLLVAPMTLGADMMESPKYVLPFSMDIWEPGAFLLIVLKSALLVPVLEELFFRGYLLGALERFGCLKAALVSALCFALVHGSGKGSEACGLLIYVVIGLLLAAVYFHTGSLFAPMLVHGCYNLTLIVISYSGLSWLFSFLSFSSCVLRLLLCILFVCCLRHAWKARGTHVQMQPMEKLTKKEMAYVAASAVAILAAACMAGGLFG